MDSMPAEEVDFGQSLCARQGLKVDWRKESCPNANHRDTVRVNGKF